MKTKYLIVGGPNILALEEQVNHMLIDGYTPCGGPFIISVESDNYSNICQAMLFIHDKVQASIDFVEKYGMSGQELKKALE